MRKHRKSTTKVLLATIVLTAAMGITAYAAEWKQDTAGWWYEQDGGSYATGWQWIDGKRYYFDGNGYMLKDTITPDGNTVDGNGAWTKDGVIQTQTSKESVPDTDKNSVQYTDYVRTDVLDIISCLETDVNAKYGDTEFPFSISWSEDPYRGDAAYASKVVGSKESMLQTTDIEELIRYYKEKGWEIYLINNPMTNVADELLIRPETDMLSNAERYEINIYADITGEEIVSVSRNYRVWAKAEKL